MKVIAFNGSARENGNTRTLLEIVLKQLDSQGIDTELVWLGDEPLSGCRACYLCLRNRDGRCSREDEINSYLEKMIEADGILLGSPTYFANVSANMKALIERCGMVARVNGDLLKRKVGAGVVAVRRAGSFHVFSSLNAFFLIGQMIVPGSSYWNLGIGKDPGEVAGDTEGVKTMEDLGKNIAWLLKRINGKV